MRLIDADMVLETCNSFKGMNRTKDIGIKLVNDIVGNAPTVDAEPIRHGYWEFHAKSIKDVLTEACSECGEWSYGDNEAYCPCCGAKMDMDEVEEDGID